jgi:Protein kinase domain/Translation initiation factor IF-2, N-terminal region
VALVRVYELAKEFGVESKTIMAELEMMGESVRSASSTVRPPVVWLLRQRLATKPPRTAPRERELGVLVYELAEELAVESETVIAELQKMGEFVSSALSIVDALTARTLRRRFAEMSPHAEIARSPTTPAAPGGGVLRSGRSSPSVVDGEVAPVSATADPYSPVRKAARGRREDYKLDPRPTALGGQAEVFRAQHKNSGIMVAFKRVKPATIGAKARMRREIHAAQAFGGNPHVMPVLDSNTGDGWFVMPLARYTAETVRLELIAEDKLRELVTAICDALRPAHNEGWIHRDLKPSNLLMLDGVWTVADWGVTRRPLGQTTNPDRTRVGEPFGTDGWAAPELSSDAHRARPQADIYSIGQIIGWAVSGQRPLVNTPLIPARGHWRQVAKAATYLEPMRRPASVDALLEIIDLELNYRRPDGAATAVQLRAANDGDGRAAAQLFAMAARYPGDVRLYTEMLPAMTRVAVAAAVDADPGQASEVVRAAAHMSRTVLRREDAAQVITRLHWIQERAGEADNLELFEEAASAVLTWDGAWDQREPQRLIRQWLAQLSGDQAAAAAHALRDHAASARHFAGLADDRLVDERIRRAVHDAG